jgi:hypothetical protein
MELGFAKDCRVNKAMETIVDAAILLHSSGNTAAAVALLDAQGTSFRLIVRALSESNKRRANDVRTIQEGGSLDAV